MSSLKSFQSLNSNREFSKVYSKPTHCWHTEWFVLFYKESSSKQSAFVASKKVGKAVARNRAKRLLRAHFIHNIPKLKNGQYIFVAKAPIVTSEYKVVSKRFHNIFQRLHLYKHTSK